MKTFILMWNPAISSIKVSDFKAFFGEPVGTDFNWSVWDWKESHVGDRFFMVRVGEEGRGKENGIVMSGHFTSEPYRGSDWSGKGREVYYMDLQPDYLFDTAKVRTLTDEFLMESFPQFDWTGGHSGRLIDAETAALLEECWEKVILGNAEILSNGRRWRTALDVFRKHPVLELWRGHYKGNVECVDVEIKHGVLSVYFWEWGLFDGESRFLPDAPEKELCTEWDAYSINPDALRKALGATDDRSLMAAIRRDYSTRDGMERLVAFAEKNGCLIGKDIILVD